MVFGFRKKCEYCRTRVEKGKEINRNVKVPGFIGTYPRYFCCEEHANNYEKEIEELTKQSKNSGRSCCG